MVENIAQLGSGIFLLEKSMTIGKFNGDLKTDWKFSIKNGDQFGQRQIK